MLTVDELKRPISGLDRGERIKLALSMLDISQAGAAESIGRHYASVRKALAQSAEHSPILFELEHFVRERIS